MVMSWIFTGIVGISVIAALVLGNGSALAAAIPQGAQAGVTLVISMAGSICLRGSLADSVHCICSGIRSLEQYTIFPPFT